MKRLLSVGLPAEIDRERRQFVLGAASVCALSAVAPLTRAQVSDVKVQQPEPAVLRDHQLELQVGEQRVNFTGRPRIATTVNQSLPAPILRWREGQEVVVRVRNGLKEDTSIHWHGIILPSEMDGVPGLSFAGIKPGETFEYRFKLRQSGTYWYHSHSHFQEQSGLYGAIIIDPAEPDPVQYDRDYVVLLSDWSDTPPQQIYTTLKKQSHYYNRHRRTLGDWWRDVRQKGFGQSARDRAMWNHMRMSETDLADVTGFTYTYLMNGITPDSGWVGLFNAGERVRLRIINGSAMTLFDVRIPGLKMTVVAADGQNIKPVEVDEFRIGAAETYDVIVEPAADRAYTIFAQSIDRSGYARGTLTPDLLLQAEIPSLDPRPVLSHADMGMGHSHHVQDARSDHPSDHQEHSAHQHHSPIDHSAHTGHSSHTDHSSHIDQSSHQQHENHGHHHGTHHDHAQTVSGKTLAPAGFGANFGEAVAVVHPRSEFGPQVDMHSSQPVSGIGDPGVGLRDNGRRVLTYADLRSLQPTRDKREPSREIELHLTGNMHRYMWSVNGIKHAEAPPIVLQHGERVRFILVNDTMMTHPFHLHGLWSELETGDRDFIPRKHTVLVQPGSKVSYLVTADAKGRWAYHCHLLYHMAGMMREVRVI